MEISAEFNKSDLRALDKDLDSLFTEFGRELASAPKMQPMVDKIRQGISENSMKFKNSEVWDNTKALADWFGVVDFSSPLMMTGQLVQDFIFYAGKPKISQIPYSDEFIIGAFTWAAKERKRPSYRYILNQLAIKEHRNEPYPGTDKFTFIKSSDLIKIIMKSPRYPVMDSITGLYHQDIERHMEKLINEAFKTRSAKRNK